MAGSYFLYVSKLICYDLIFNCTKKITHRYTLTIIPSNNFPQVKQLDGDLRCYLDLSTTSIIRHDTFGCVSLFSVTWNICSTYKRYQIEFLDVYWSFGFDYWFGTVTYRCVCSETIVLWPDVRSCLVICNWTDRWLSPSFWQKYCLHLNTESSLPI